METTQEKTSTSVNSNTAEDEEVLSHHEFQSEEDDGQVRVGSHEEISWHLVTAVVWACLLAYSCTLSPCPFLHEYNLLCYFFFRLEGFP